MNSRLNLIESIFYTNLNDITHYSDLLNGSVSISTTKWNKIPIFSGSGSFNVESSPEVPGSLFISTISARLNDSFILNHGVLIKVELCDGNSYIIGTRDYPVFLNQYTSLTQKSLKISHRNTFFPLKMA